MESRSPGEGRDFRVRLHGELILPNDGGYDSARRVWNGMIDNYPALICRCADRSDVMRAGEEAKASSAHAFRRKEGCQHLKARPTEIG